jgi:hypothetical protein
LTKRKSEKEWSTTKTLTSLTNSLQRRQ